MIESRKPFLDRQADHPQGQYEPELQISDDGSDKLKYRLILMCFQLIKMSIDSNMFPIKKMFGQYLYVLLTFFTSVLASCKCSFRLKLWIWNFISKQSLKSTLPFAKFHVGLNFPYSFFCSLLWFYFLSLNFEPKTSR